MVQATRPTTIFPADRDDCGPVYVPPPKDGWAADMAVPAARSSLLVQLARKLFVRAAADPDLSVRSRHELVREALVCVGLARWVGGAR
jgi:hypothetical protein